MRALEDYNRQRDKKLGAMVGGCMKSLGLCYLVINILWLMVTLISGGFHLGLLRP